jgi:hypothetical protein
MKIVAACALIGLAVWAVQGGAVSDNDVYADGLVYLKRDSMPYTGSVSINDPPHSANYAFCEGRPCGNWEYRFKGDLIHKGQYLDKSTLPLEVQRLFERDTLSINHWQEGEFPNQEYPPFLSIELLRPLSFFEISIASYQPGALKMAEALVHTTGNLRYDFITIIYTSDFFRERQRIKFEYDVRSGSPVLRASE